MLWEDIWSPFHPLRLSEFLSTDMPLALSLRFLVFLLYSAANAARQPCNLKGVWFQWAVIASGIVVFRKVLLAGDGCTWFMLFNGRKSDVLNFGLAHHLTSAKLYLSKDWLNLVFEATLEGTYGCFEALSSWRMAVSVRFGKGICCRIHNANKTSTNTLNHNALSWEEVSLKALTSLNGKLVHDLPI